MEPGSAAPARPAGPAEVEEIRSGMMSVFLSASFASLQDWRTSAARADDPLFTVTYPTMRGNIIHRRMSGQKLYKIVKALGMAHGIPTLHPHALRHACAVEMLRRTRNLAAVQQHLRHVDVNTTTIYARLLPQDMEEVAKLFDRDAMR